MVIVMKVYSIMFGIDCLGSLLVLVSIADWLVRLLPHHIQEPSCNEDDLHEEGKDVPHPEVDDGVILAGTLQFKLEEDPEADWHQANDHRSVSQPQNSAPSSILEGLHLRYY